VTIRRTRNGSTPTVLLVHDAFSDTGSWAGTDRAGRGLHTEIIAVPNPLRGLASDAAYVALAVAECDGPVLLVGHGYGGAVVSVAAASAGNVVGLVHLAAFLPDRTRAIVDILRAAAAHRFLAALRPYRSGSDTEIFLDRREYPAVLAADLDPSDAAVAAALQRPIRAAAFEERPQAVADLPSWYLIASADRVLDVPTQRVLAAGSISTEVDASHSVPLSRPVAVAELIGAALSIRRAQ
jgi:pimeloyl-ACP methyl ester carboxylesterase